MVSNLKLFMQENLPLPYLIYMKIAEPRVVRILLFIIYLAGGVIGVVGLVHPPHNFQLTLNPHQVTLMFGFITLGSVFTAVSVLPGVWWLERTGLLAFGTGIGFYILILIDRNSSMLGLGVAFIALISFAIRWIEIRRYQLAPREG